MSDRLAHIAQLSTASLLGYVLDTPSEDSIGRPYAQRYVYLPRYGDEPDVPAAAAPRTSFGFAGFFAGEAGVQYMKLYGGYVKYSGRLNVSIADTTDDPLTHVQVTGTSLNPTRVCVRMDKSDNSVALWPQNTEPEDDNSYWYYTLHEAYLNDEGMPVYGKDRRLDWRLGSPIG